MSTNGGCRKVVIVGPGWLHRLSAPSLLLGAVGSIVIAAEMIRQSQHMGITDVVGPVSALFGTVWVAAAMDRGGDSSPPAEVRSVLFNS